MRYSDIRRRIQIQVIFRFLVSTATFLLAGYTLIVLRIRNGQTEDVNIILDRQPSVRTYLLDSPDLEAAKLTLSDAQMVALQQLRQDRITKHCTLPVQHKIRDQLPHAWSAIKDNKHKLLYCSIRRCATTAWKQYLMYLNNNLIDPGNKLKPDDFFANSNFDKLHRSDVNELIKNDPKVISFLFVRDPWIRLVSAYISSVKESNYALKKRKPCSWYKISSSILTFSDFVTCITVTALKYGSRSLDDRWKPQYLFCSLCFIRYKHIGHMETIAADFNYIMKLAGKNANKTELSSISSRSTNEVPAIAAKNYYKMLTKEQVLQLQTLYRPDFELHGYRYLPPGW